jgi:hypothetical protein
MLLPIGPRVISEMKSGEIKKLGLIFEQDGQGQFVNTKWNRIYIGKLKWRDKEFPVAKLP